MDQFTSLLMAFVGGTSLPLIITTILNRRRTKLDTNGVRDEQVGKWMDKTLGLADELLKAKSEIAELKEALSRCTCGAEVI